MSTGIPCTALTMARSGPGSWFHGIASASAVAPGPLRAIVKAVQAIPVLKPVVPDPG
ncbi:hypothetical protein MAHJHV51_57250 [Mycobacterium avium subsp. hominissuis]